MPSDPVRLRDSATLRRLFWPAVCLALFLLLFATWRLYWKVQLMNEIDRMHAAGYPADLAELDAWYHRPAGENAAGYWLKAQEAWHEDPKLEIWLPAFSTTDEGVAAYAKPRLGERYPDEVLDKEQEYFAKNQESLAWMEKAAQTKECRWPVDFNKGFEMVTPDWGIQNRGVRLWREHMRLLAERPNGGNIWEAAGVGFRLGPDALAMPTLSSTSVGLITDGGMIRAIEQELPFLAADSAGLEQFHSLLFQHRARLDAAFIKAERGEQLIARHFEDKVIRERRRFLDKAKWRTWLLLGGEDHDLWKITKQDLHWLTLPRPPSRDDRCTARARLDKECFDSKKGWELLCKEYPPSVLGSVRVNMECRILSHFDAALTAIAVERHRLDTGRLPATLNELVPKYLPAVPPDLFDAGKPFKYKVESDRFTVYSIGKNGLDEGGEYGTDVHPDADDIGFTILLPNAKRGVVQKRKPAEAE